MPVEVAIYSVRKCHEGVGVGGGEIDLVISGHCTFDSKQRTSRP